MKEQIEQVAEQLPAEQRLKDYIFAAIVEAFWKARITEVAASV
jgi:hypothetical protein